MVRPLEILEKILRLEEGDYNYQDKAVSGGLARYADTWQKQASDVYGESASSWVEEIAEQLRAYSSLPFEARQTAMQSLWDLLRHPPGQDITEMSGVNKVLESAPSTLQQTQETGAGEVVESTLLKDKSGRGLNAPVYMLSGVGKKRSQLLEKLGVHTIRELLYLYPRRYEDYSQLKTINRLEYGERTSIIASVWEAGGRETRGGKYLFRAILSDVTGTLEVTWFNQKFLEGRIRPGMQIVVSGKVDQYLGHLTMNSPEWELLGHKDLMAARIQPIYPLTEGLTQRWMRQTMQRALSAWADRVPDALPKELLREQNLLGLARALWGIHLPDSSDHFAEAKRRLAFEEALYLQLGLLRQRALWEAQHGRAIVVDSAYLKVLQSKLPYVLTDAQKRSLEEIFRDMGRTQPMNRLLQGDVGSGKTVVAALLMAVTAAAGFQTAMMAPTEILAEQHYKSLAKLFDVFPLELRPQMGLLTGNVTSTDRQSVYAGLKYGSLQVVVGTHALIQEAVKFKNLAFVVIDEQHRFGVEQRGALREKGYNPHLLVMTATPIPRSLELTIWGHVDVSILDEMPPGRQPIKTRVLYPRERERAYAFIRSQVQQGRQAFIIYPLVESSEKIEARAAVDEYERLQSEIFPDLRLGLLHGRLHSDEKDAVMMAFSKGELNVLVATSVIEVGIDVPNATVILIDGADRFGLAQLHQFRGRVGRGDHQSYCLLLAENASEEVNERLQVMESTTDGFVLAEKDLEMRGPGEFLGTQQSGFPELPMASLADTRLLHKVREIAGQILHKDPDLSLPEHRELAQRVAEFWSTEVDLS
ncbi:MAG: ATP-dependent DNA helicase RecG [Anaerolineae bacterium]|nr:ATP-dependent DNA helicase RecG [Anaerolineae bacterium]